MRGERRGRGAGFGNGLPPCRGSLLAGRLADAPTAALAPRPHQPPPSPEAGRGRGGVSRACVC
eukprot:scaffold33459_cov79-Isochrysis_galbana.AAC.2